jgi:hypothetical protein
MFKLARGRPLTAALKAVKVRFPSIETSMYAHVDIRAGLPSVELSSAEAESLDTRISLR